MDKKCKTPQIFLGRFACGGGTEKRTFRFTSRNASSYFFGTLRFADYSTQFRENAANMMLGFNKHWGYSHLILSYYHLTLGIAEVDGSDSYTYAKELPFQQIHHYKIVNDNVFYIGKGTLHSILGYQ